jgi:ethanolamine ammonia-lyase large subunit
MKIEILVTDEIRDGKPGVRIQYSSEGTCSKVVKAAVTKILDAVDAAFAGPGVAVISKTSVTIPVVMTSQPANLARN